MEKTEFPTQMEDAKLEKGTENLGKICANADSKSQKTSEQQEPLIELRDIYKIYYMGDEEVHANDGISLSINKGEFVAIVGKSGSGKSTLMNIIGALDVRRRANTSSAARTWRICPTMNWQRSGTA